jgi:hypothetical protein
VAAATVAIAAAAAAAATADQLTHHVARRSDPLLLPHVVGDVGARAKVDQEEDAVGLAPHDVGRLNVAVNHPLAVHVREDSQHREQHPVDRRAGPHTFVVHQLHQVSACVSAFSHVSIFARQHFRTPHVSAFEATCERCTRTVQHFPNRANCVTSANALGWRF